MNEWKVSCNYIDGKPMYIVYKLRDEKEADHSGNRTYATQYMYDKELAEKTAAQLNQKENGMQKDIFGELRKKASYALNSKSLVLVYQTYGEACMAYQLEAISKNEYFELNEMLICNGVNNSKAGLE